MKNVLKNVLLCIPILAVIMMNSNVYAANETCRTTQLTKPNAKRIYLPDIRGRGTSNFYEFKIDGYKAFCIDPGKTMGSNKEYTLNPYYRVKALTKQAYNYADTHPSDNDQLAAQVVIWAVESAGITNHTIIIRNIQEALISAGYYRSSNPFQVYQAASRIFNGILSTTAAGNINVWEKYDRKGGYQRLITRAPNSTKTCKTTDDTDKPDTPDNSGDDNNPIVETCDIENVSSLAYCTGTSNRNFGYIQEVPKGNCDATYTKKKANVSGQYTKFAGEGKYCRMFCLQSFSQTYPGNIARAVNAGRYIVWPNNNITNNQKKINANLSKYPLQLTLNKTCDIYVDNSTLTKDYNGFKKTMSQYSKYQDEYINAACSNLKSTLKTKEETLNKEQSSYDSCTKSITYSDSTTCTRLVNGVSSTVASCNPYSASTCTCKTDKVPSHSCDSTALDKAKKEKDAAQKEVDNCNAYGTAYEGAKSVIRDINSCASATITNDLGFSADFSSSYNDPTYGGSFTLTESSSSQNCTGCTSNISKLGENPLSINSNNLLSLSASIQNREIEAAITKTYDLADNYYYYVDKYTNKSVSSLGALSTNANGQKSYSTIGFSNMPISYDAKVGKDNSNYYYNLSLNVSISGTPFDAELNSQDYTCHYEVTKTTSDCICPSGTESEGTNLNCKIKEYNSKNTEKITCADGQILYCNSKITEEEAKCDPITCPNDPSMDLSFCINSGESYESCSNTYCSGGNGNEDGGGKKYHCPKGTSNEGMDITACVIPMMNKGISEQDAYEYCKDVTCPFKGGVKIIYRTISLSNPFPSFDADSKVNQKGLTVGMFNDTVKGRYPGSNWNSTRVVRSKILNNRGVDGDKVYQKQPLYTFTLNSATIKEIRKYNKSQKNKYADFNLDCKKNSSTACVSSFVHSTTSGLTSGTCAGKLTASNFYSCNS